MKGEQLLAQVKRNVVLDEIARATREQDEARHQREEQETTRIEKDARRSLARAQLAMVASPVPSLAPNGRLDGHKRCCAARHRRDGNPSKRSAATCVDHAAARFDGAGCALYLGKTKLALRSIGSALRQLHPADDEAEGRVTATRQPESGT